MANVLSIAQKTAVMLEEVGTACAEYQDRVIQNISANRVQVDEIWSFVGAKAKNTKPEHFENGGYAGDAWTFVADSGEGNKHSDLKSIMMSAP